MGQLNSKTIAELSKFGNVGRFGSFGFFGTFALLLLECLSFLLALAEFIHSAGDVNQFLFARVEGMARRTDFHRHLGGSGAGFKRITAGAGHGDGLVVLWVDFGFHMTPR